MKKIILFFIVLIPGIGCKEPYNVPSPSPPTGYLVVEGFINNGQGPTGITLTRTTKLYDSVDIIYERNAQLSIEGENNESFPLYESINGTYLSSQLYLNSNKKYRLHIKTTDGKEYLSDFATVKSTPPIDSVSWKRENGVQIYISTHDPQNNTRYYQWKYEETWEFHSAYKSELKYVLDPNTNSPIGIRDRNPDQTADTTIYKCWKTNNSTNIALGSSEKLTQDLIYLPLIYLEPGSAKLTVLYSINVRQYALSHEAYLFLQKIKKNTEQLGSLFDPQPSELQGNIHCITYPAEVVVGYVEVSREQQQRIFINRSQVPDWAYTPRCRQIKIDNNRDSIMKYGSGVIPTVPAAFAGMSITAFYATEERCMNCTLQGTNVRPAFWP